MTTLERLELENEGWRFIDESFVDGHSKDVEHWFVKHVNDSRKIALNDTPWNLSVDDFRKLVDVTQEPKELISTYLPEMWNVKKDTIYAAIAALESGLEYAMECLATHDADLGRTTRKNKTWAVTMEYDIRHMRQTLEALQSILP